MIVIGKLYTVSAVADVLARTLGSGRQWVDTLNDFRQERSTGLKGVVLLPYQRTGGTITTSGQPLYRLEDLRSFVIEVRRAYKCERPFQARTIIYEYDDTPGHSLDSPPSCDCDHVNDESRHHHDGGCTRPTMNPATRGPRLHLAGDPNARV